MRAFDMIGWLFGAFVLSVLFTLPTGFSAQIGLASVGLLALAVIGQIGSKPFLRQLVIVVAMAFTVKYFYWRVSSTLPPADAVVDLTLALLVLTAEAFCIVFLFLSVFVMADPLKRRRTPAMPTDAPTVDIFVPSYNEDYDIVANTLAAAKAVEYPADKLNVYLLDDGATDQKLNSDDPETAATALERKAQLSALCARLGVHYLARARNEMAKAGNLNFGLENSSGEIVVVFDADHAPMRHFLTETVGHFAEDERLFLVQTPHAFLNPDPVERNIGFAGYAPSENEMFYGSVQPGLDSWNAAFFCGSATLLRRSALEEVDGFSGSSITEDCETAISLHSRGWNSRYVPTPMVLGLQPETFAAFIGQRSRWCRGMIQIFLMKCPWFTPGLTLPQRLCYTSSSMFWFFPLVRMVFLLAPLLFIFFDFRIYAASAMEFAAYAVPYLISAIILQSFVFGQFRWPWVSEVYEYVQSVYLAKAVLSVLVSPHKPTFNVTEKGATLAESRLSSLALPYYVIFGVLLIATAYTGYRYETEPSERTLLLVVGFWNLFNLLIAGLALGCVSERQQRRRNPRIAMDRAAELMVGEECTMVTITNASLGGLEISPSSAAATRFKLGADGEIIFSGAEDTTLKVRVTLSNRISGADDPRYGLSFDQSDERRFDVLNSLIFAGSAGTSARDEDGRSRRNIFLWTAELMGYALQSIVRGLVFALFRNPRRARQRAAGAKSAAH